jgi:hypothetical protein
VTSEVVLRDWIDRRGHPCFLLTRDAHLDRGQATMAISNGCSATHHGSGPPQSSTDMTK